MKDKDKDTWYLVVAGLTCFCMVLLAYMYFTKTTPCPNCDKIKQGEVMGSDRNYYFSELQKTNNIKTGWKPREVKINDEWVEYTEMKDTENKSFFGDATFLGVASCSGTRSKTKEAP